MRLSSSFFQALGNVVIFGDLLNRLLVLHRLSGDAGFEFGTQGPSFLVTHFWSYCRGVAPLDQLNSSISIWLRFLGPLQFYLAQCAVICEDRNKDRRTTDLRVIKNGRFRN